MSATLSVDPPELAKLPTALRAIAGAAGASALDVLRGEAGVILKACAAGTSIATADRADKRSRLRYLRDQQLTGRNGMMPVTVTAGAKKGSEYGRVFLRTATGGWRRTHDAVFRPVAGIPSSGRKKPGDHYREHDWLLLRSTIATVRGGITAARTAGRKTIGLGRQSWVQIADTLGIRLEDVRGGSFFGKSISGSAIAKARAAVASNGQSYSNGLGTLERTQYETIITLLNRYPAGHRTGMDRILQSAIVSRVRYFEKNMELGVFNAIEKTVRAYPYLQVLSRG
jgi:hypothetical protein